MKSDDGLVMRLRLTTDDLTQLGQLAASCTRAEDRDFNFVTEMAAEYAGDLPCPLWFEHGHMVGGVALQGPDGGFEAVLLVHPDHRRRGLGRALLAAVITACAEQGIGDLLLVGVEGASSGRAFAAAVGATYRFSEYRMALVAEPDMPPPTADLLQVRPVLVDEFPTYERVSAAAFGMVDEQQRRTFAGDLEHPDRRLYLGWLGNIPVATGRTVRGEREAFITNLGVLPDYRRRGFGRQILVHLIARLEADSGRTISIEVATDNIRALSLYRACGFQVTTAFTYYHVDVARTRAIAG